MRVLLVALTIGSALFTGCRIDPNAEREIALLRSEILDLEDKYYSLKNRCDPNSNEYYEGSVNGAPLHQESAPGEVIYSEPDIIHDPSGDIFCDSSPDNAENYAPAYSNPHIQFNPAETMPPASMDEGSRQPTVLENSGAATDSETLPPFEIEFENNSQPNQQLQVGTDSEVAAISINRSISGGHDLDGVPGHEGLVLLIQPETRTGQVIQQPGSLTINVTEPSLQATRNSIARWSFTAGEVKNFFVKDDYPDKGILLHLPWDEIRPSTRSLLVRVEFTTIDNRTFETVREFEIEPPNSDYSVDDPIVAQWVERDERWRDISTARNTWGNDARRTSTPLSRNEADTPSNRPQWRPIR